MRYFGLSPQTELVVAMQNANSRSPEKIAPEPSLDTLQCCNLDSAHNHTTQPLPSLRFWTPSRERDWWSWDVL
jgi:hypothetical protein